MSEVTDLITGPVGWLHSPGTQHGIVVSSRIRLARNSVAHGFQRTLSRTRQQDLVGHLLGRIARATGWTDAWSLDMGRLSEVERQALTERQLISRELAAGKRPSAAYGSADQRFALMINEEDHLRLQVIAAGLSLDDNLRLAQDLDRTLDNHIAWAVHPRFGYLSACPTNTGTGLRASVMLHLPALADSQDLKAVLRGLSKLHMTVRGLHGEGSEASGHFYQISNHRSLGHTEEEFVADINEAVTAIASHEELARTAMLEHSRWRIEDKVHRAFALLRAARSLAYDELIDQLSWVRLGTALGLLPARWETLDRILVECQSAHLHLIHGAATTPEGRDRTRAELVRGWLG